MKKKILKYTLYSLIVLATLGISITLGLIMFKVIPAPDWLWWLVVLKG